MEELNNAKSPLIVVGAGASEKGIEDVLKHFLNGIKVPFSVTPTAKNYIDEFDPLYLGVVRADGETQKVFEYMKNSDFVLFLGGRMQEREMKWRDSLLIKDTKLAQIDPDAAEIGRAYPVDFSSVGSISSFVDLVEVIEHRNAVELKETVDSLKDKFPRKDRYKDGNGINPFNINNIIEESASENATIVCDTGYSRSLAVVKFRTGKNQKFVVADNNGPMGHSIPAALGAAIATGEEVICFVGDGGSQMSINELGTAMNYGLKVIFIIQKNGGCASLKDYHSSVYGHHCATTFENPDFIKIAEAYKMDGYRVRTSIEFEEAFVKAKKSKVSVIIEAEVDQSLMIWE